MANDFVAGQFIDFNLLPIGKKLTRQWFITVIECITNASEVMAELAKSEGDIKQDHVPSHSKEPAQKIGQGPMNENGQTCGRTDQEGPSQPSL